MPYVTGLIEKYGKDIFDTLKDPKHSFEMSRSDYIDMILIYQAKLKDQEERHGIC
jgi:hypothetical protein